MNKKFYIRMEPLGGVWYFMIYEIKTFLWFEFHYFFERWNTPESAIERLKEL